MILRLFLLVLAAALLAGAASSDEALRTRGAELLQPFKQELQSALRSGLAEGAPQAIEACRVKAPEIARTLSTDGVRVGRSSHKLRNPANLPPDWVRPAMEAYLADAADRAARVSRLPEGRAGYVEPILMKPLCTTCHGSSLTPEVAERIRELYPEDRATGFQAGELRGVFWVEFPAE